MKILHCCLLLFFCLSRLAAAETPGPGPSSGPAQPPSTGEPYEVLPNFNDLTTEEGDSALSMSCGKIDASSIHCHVVQMSVDQAPPERTEKKIKSGKQTVSQMSADKFKEAKEQFCTHFGDDSKLLKSDKKIKNRAFHTERARIAKRLCEAKSKAIFSKILEALIRFEGKLCVISERLLQLNFIKFSDTAWITTSKPQGPCKVITTMQLERDSKSEYLWTYKETNASTLTSDPKCMAEQNLKPLVYSWDQPRLLGATCEYVRLGKD